MTLLPRIPRRATTNAVVAGRVGVLMYDTSFEVDHILAATIPLILAQGREVAGLLQRFGDRLDNGKRSMWIEDIRTGATIRLDRPRAAPLLLDPLALASAGALLRQAVASGADLIVANRFGNAEADGGGLRAELAQAIGSGADVLVPVRFSLLDDLEAFLGEAANLLLPSPLAIADWAEGRKARALP